MSAPLPFSEALRLDAELVRLARGASAVRLALGGVLDALSASGGQHELGFSSFEAYARERCARTGRWAADTRALSRQVRSLPTTRAALVSAAIGWSTAELLARHVTADSELAWLEKARSTTVRELRAQLAQGAASGIDDELESETVHTLTVSTAREDAWAFECARKVAEAVMGPTPHDLLLESLLAEGYSTLLELEPDCAELLELDALENEAVAEAQAHAAWCSERKRWRNEAEELCESRWSAAEFDATEPTRTQCVPSSTTRPEALDREVRRLCAELSERDLALGIVAESARKADVWRRLGFATEAQYARERLGVSVSSLKAKRILASRAERLPELAAALASGRIGYEAAYLLSRVATPTTAQEWIARTEQRTAQRFGRVTLRFRVTERTYRFYRALERAFTRLGARVCRGRASFLRFLCENFCRVWLPALRHARLAESGELPEYFAVYRRDAFRCTSPVCTRRDVTPHHLVFRSHGGGDEEENVTSLCVWCHLSGIHEGRIAADQPASNIRWRIGRRGTLRIEGRTLVA